MEGRVTDPEGKPLPDVTVRLNNPARGGGPTLKTDRKGRWAAGGIVAGAWNIDFEAAGFATKKVSVSLPGEYARIPPVEVKLDKAAPPGPPPEVLESLRKGDEFFKGGQYAEARQEYEKLLALRPDLAATIHKQIAFCYSKEGNREKQLEELQCILDADPQNAEIRILMAMVALEGRMFDRGLELLKGVDESTIKSPDVFFNIGVGFHNADKPEEAATYFTKAVTLDPTYADGYFQRALTYFRLQKLAEAKADFRRVLELTPTGPQAETAKKALDQLK